MTTVAVTGAAGYLGRLLVERLGNEPDVKRVIGIDVAEPGFTSRNFEFYRMDARSPQLPQVIGGCDAIVHLAAVSDADSNEIRDVNVGGTRAVAEAATRGAVRKIVFASSHRVYGAHPDNDYPLVESSPLRPGHDDAYALSKTEAESVLAYYAEAHPDTTVTVLRFAWACGPNLPTSHAAVVDAKVRFVIKGYDPPFQAVHEDDAVGAIAFALVNNLPTVLNVCADDVVERADELLGQRRVTLDLDRAKRVLGRTARLGLSVPPSEVGVLMYPQVMSNDALRSAGFVPQHTTQDALRQGAEARREWVAVGRMRFRPRRVALVAGTLGAVALGSSARAALRRRRPPTSPS
jgi:nucleoside-diphosphate-sugar epimerase